MMNTLGWLAGGGTAPIIIGLLADRYGLGFAISLAAAVYVVAGLLLVLGIARYVHHDVKA
jgi:hypothetical protein